MSSRGMSRSNPTQMTPSSSNRSSRATMDPVPRSMHSQRESEITLAPTGDGVSDYQQYLEKTSNPRDSSIVASPPPVVSTPLGHRDHSIRTSRTETAMSDYRKARVSNAFEPIKSATRRKRKLHRVEHAEDPREYPGPLTLAILTAGICLSVFLISLDRTIVATVNGPESRSSMKLRLNFGFYRLSQKSPTTSILIMTWAGMEVRTSSLLELSSLSTAEFI